MSQCCNKSESNRYPKKYRCPVNGREYAAVGLSTILHHIQNPWHTALAEQGYYYCTDPNCKVVYFGQDDTVILKSQMRSKVFQKEQEPDRLVCYCFGVTLQQTRVQEIRNFVVQKTKASQCACEIANPSGHCCLKDFLKQ